MTKHPEDQDDWTTYTNKGDWEIPKAAEPVNQEPPTDGPAFPPHLASAPFDDRDPNPPRQSTPYNETNPWTNNQAWRYQQNPYEGNRDEHRSDWWQVVGMGVAIGVGLVILGLILI